MKKKKDRNRYTLYISQREMDLIDYIESIPRKDFSTVVREMLRESMEFRKGVLQRNTPPLPIVLQSNTEMLQSNTPEEIEPTGQDDYVYEEVSDDELDDNLDGIIG
jgi:hypothetical protein